jgi:hypothetical protein
MPRVDWCHQNLKEMILHLVTTKTLKPIYTPPLRESGTKFHSTSSYLLCPQANIISNAPKEKKMKLLSYDKNNDRASVSYRICFLIE